MDIDNKDLNKEQVKESTFLNKLIQDFGESMNSLILVNSENIVKLDDNLVLFSLTSDEELKALKEKPKAFKSGNKGNFKTVLNNYKMKEDGEFLAFSRHGMLFGEVVNLVAMILGDNGKLLGYAFKLKDVSLLQKEFSFFDLDGNSSAVMIYMLGKLGMEDGYFICNNIDNEVIKNSCNEVHEDLKLSCFNGSYLLTFNKKRYHYVGSVWTESETNRKFSNIGKFIP